MKSTIASLAVVSLLLLAPSAQAKETGSSGHPSNPGTSHNGTGGMIVHPFPRYERTPSRAARTDFNHALNDWRIVLTSYWTGFGYRLDEARSIAGNLSMADMAKIAKTRELIRNYSRDEMANAINKAVAAQDFSLANRLLISTAIELGDRKQS